MLVIISIAEQLEKMHEQLRMYQQRELQLTSNHRELEEGERISRFH